MARYFAMIGGERQGPFSLSDFPDAGIGPDTYIWCKGLPDWEKAGDNADVCRFFRQRIFDMMHPVAQTPKENVSDVPAGEENVTAGGRMVFPMPPEEPADLDVSPVPMLTISVILTLLCFPLTGFVAIYYSVLSRRAWNMAEHSESKNGSKLYTDQERRECRRSAHDYARSAKMWAGITFFLGIIVYAFFTYRHTA